VNAADYRQQLAALLPTGPALPREPGSVLMRLLEPPAAELARIELRAIALLDEADPRVTAEMLVDWERAFGLPDDCSPIDSFERASEATYFDGAGVLRIASINVPRPVFDPLTGQPTGTIWIEQGSANEVRNPRGEGLVPGSPGTMPTHWTLNVGAGLTRQVVGAGVVNGMPYVDIRVSGTPTGTSGQIIAVEAVAGVPATSGEIWTSSAWLAIVGGSTAGLTNMRWNTQGTNGTSSTEVTVNVIIGTISGTLQRFATTRPLNNAGTTHLRAGVEYNYAAGVPFDFTIRIAGAQIERGAVATSLVLPPVGSPGRSVRAPDIARTATVEERRDALLGRITGLGGQSRAYYIAVAAALGYPITIAEPRPFRCGISTVGMGLRDNEWAHCWLVYSAGEAERLFRLGASAVGDAFRSWGENLLECVISRIAPAHTRVLFGYGPDMLLLTDEFEALGTDGGELITP
jgi:uncharacterized protein YmfQ (DUF2313 family)